MNAELMQSVVVATRDRKEVMAADLSSVFDLVADAPGAVNRLKDLIVSLAVQGRLVAQRSSEEQASVLITKIRQLMPAAKTRVSVSPIRPDELPFEVPQTWKWVRLADFIPFRIGRTPPTKDARYWCTNGIPWVSIGDMQHRGVVRSTARTVTALSSNLFGYEPLPIGTLLMSFKLTIGKVAVLGQAAYHNEAIVSFLPLAGVGTEFLQIVLPWAAERGASKGAIKGATLNSQSLTNLVIPVPPLREQERIARRFSELMELCQRLEYAHREEAEQHSRLASVHLDKVVASESPKALVENWLRADQDIEILLDRPDAIPRFEETLIELAVRGLLSPARADRMSAYDRDPVRREQGVEDVVSGRILEAEEMFVTPDTWRWRRIEDICSVQGGIQKTPLRRPVKHHFPYLRVANVQRDKLVLDQIERYELTDEEVDTWRLRAGDLLVVEGNGSEDEIGRCAIWDGSIDPCVYQNHLIRVRAREAGFVEFLKLFLNSPSGISEMKRLAITTSGLYNLSVGKIRNIVVPVPPALEQQQIVVRVAELRRLCAALRGCLSSKLEVQERLSEVVVNSCGG